MSTLEAFWSIRIAAEQKSSFTYADRELRGAVNLTQDLRSAFHALDNAGDLPDLRVSGKLCPIGDLPTSGEASFKARAPKQYFETLSELIQRHPQSPPDDFRIYSIPDEDEKRELYLTAVQLASLLNELAANKNHKGCTIFANDALEIPFLYGKEDLKPIPDLNAITKLMTGADNLEPEAARLLDIYRSLFKQSLSDVVSSTPREKRFPNLIGNFSECVFRFRLSFKRFSDEANAAIERYEETRAGMIAALNGVLGNIQTSLIGIPLAGLLALKEIQPATGLIYGNVIIAGSVVAVGVLLMLLTFSQGKTLGAIKEQHEHLTQEIKDSGGGETKIGRSLNSMARHEAFISKLLIVVRIIIAVFIIIPFWILFFR